MSETKNLLVMQIGDIREVLASYGGRNAPITPGHKLNLFDPPYSTIHLISGNPAKREKGEPLGPAYVHFQPVTLTSPKQFGDPESEVTKIHLVGAVNYSKLFEDASYGPAIRELAEEYGFGWVKLTGLTGEREESSPTARLSSNGALLENQDLSVIVSDLIALQSAIGENHRKREVNRIKLGIKSLMGY